MILKSSNNFKWYTSVPKRSLSQIILSGLLLLPVLGLAQNMVNKDTINVSNYYKYDFYELTGLPYVTNWLRRNEVIPIIIEELVRYDFKYNYNYVPCHMPDNNTIVLDVLSSESKIGFVFHTGHYADPNKKHRDKTDFETLIYDSKGEFYKRATYQSMPPNIHVLREDWYWYQYLEHDDKNMAVVSRDVIIKILREDIRNILKKYKNLDEALAEKAEDARWGDIIPNTPIVGQKYVGWDKVPQFLGGQAGLDKYIRESTYYPLVAQQNRQHGRLKVEYTVNENGDIQDVKIIEGGAKSLEDEAIRVLKEMPKWRPGVQNGKKVPVKYYQLFNFTL